MITLLIGLIILLIVLGVAFWIIQQIPLPPNLRWVVMVAFGLVVLLVVLNWLPVGLPGGLPHGRWR